MEFHRARAESRQSSATDASDDVLAEEMAEFLRQQAEKESGELNATTEPRAGINSAVKLALEGTQDFVPHRR